MNFCWGFKGYSIYGKCCEISNTFLFLFSNKMLVFRVGNYKMFIKIANREVQKQSDLGLPCLFRHFRQVYGKCCEISNTFLFCSQIKCWFLGLEFTNTCQNTKQGRPWSDCFFTSSLIWVCPVCLGIFGKQLVYSYFMLVCSIVKTITPRCCGRPDSLLHEAEGRVQ